MKTADLNRKNISVHLDTYERLGSYGTINDSYTEVIDKIMDFAVDRGMTRETLMAFTSAKKTATNGL